MWERRSGAWPCSLHGFRTTYAAALPRPDAANREIKSITDPETEAEVARHMEAAGQTLAQHAMGKLIVIGPEAQSASQSANQPAEVDRSEG